MNLQEKIEAAQAHIDILQAMQQHPGYILLRDLMRQQEILRRNSILQDSFNGLDGAITRGNLVSELQGMSLVIRMPDLLIEDARLTIQACQEQLRSEEEDKKDG